MLETFESSRNAGRPLEFRGAGKPQDVSMLDVSGMVSRTLGLPADSPEVTRFAGELHGTINNDPVLRHAALTGGGIQSFILGRVPPDIADKLDPARRAEADRQRQMQTANRSGSEYAAALGQLGGGVGGFMQSREARSGGDGGSGGGSRSGQSPNSGARYDSVPGGDWSSSKGMAITRSYAMGNDMAWATKEPDLMRMGQPALKSLKDAGLKGDGYHALREPSGLHFDNPTIVNGAEYMKRNGGDYNGAAKASAAVDKVLDGPDKSEHKRLLKGLYDTKGGKGSDEAKKSFKDAGDRWIERKPSVAPKVYEERRRMNIEQGAALKAGANAAQKGAALDADFDSYGGAPTKPTGSNPPTEPVQRASNDPPKDAKNTGEKPIVVAAATPSDQNKSPGDKKPTSAQSKAAPPSMNC